MQLDTSSSPSPRFSEQTNTKAWVTVIPNGDERLSASMASSISAQFLNNGYPDWEQTPVTQLIRLSALQANPWNNRRFTNSADLDSLVDGIRENGLHTPIKICMTENSDDIFITAGHRRCTALGKVGVDLVPCKLDSRVRLNEQEMREALLADNDGRQSRAPIERAQDYAALLAATGTTQESAARSLSISVATLRLYLKLLDLPEQVQGYISDGKLSATQGYWISKHKGGASAQIETALSAIENNLPAKSLERIAMRSGEGQNRKSTTKKKTKRQASKPSYRKWTIPGSAGISIEVAYDKGGLDTTRTREMLTEALTQVPTRMHNPNQIHGLPLNPDSNTTDQSVQSKNTNAEPRSSFPSKIGVGIGYHQSPRTDTSDRSVSYTAEPPPVADRPRSEVEVSAINARREGRLEGEGSLVQLESGETSSFARAYKVGSSVLHSCSAASLDALFLGGTPDWEKTDVTQLIHVNYLHKSPYDNRDSVQDIDTYTISRSIEEIGIHTTIKVCMGPQVESCYIIGGRRRFEAARKLGYHFVPCELDRRGKLTESEMREAMLRDQEAASPVMPVDRALGYRDYMRSYNMSAEAAAKRLSVPEQEIKNHLELLSLPESIQELIDRGRLNLSHASALLLVPQETQQIALAERALAEDITGKRLKEMARRIGSGHRVRSSGKGLDAVQTTWRVGSERRGRVHISVDKNGSNVDEEQVRAALEHALANLDEAAASTEPEPQVSKTDHLVPLSKVLAGDIGAFTIVARKYLLDLFKDIDKTLYLDTECVSALTLELGPTTLQRAGLTCTDQTFISTQTWGNIRGDTVTPMQVIAYWAWCIDRLEGMTKSQLAEQDIAIGPIDFSGELPVSRQKVLDELKSKIKDVPTIVHDQLLNLTRDLKLQEAVANTSTLHDADKRFMNRSELEAAGLEMRGAFLHRFKKWGIYQKPALTSTFGRNGDEETRLNLSELERYLSYCLSSVNEIAGGKDVGRIGKSQIQEKYIPYYPPNGEIKRSYAMRSVRDQIAKSIAVLQDLIEQVSE